MLDSILNTVLGVVTSAEGMAGGNEADAQIAAAEAAATREKVKLAALAIGAMALVAVLFFAFKARKK